MACYRCSMSVVRLQVLSLLFLFLALPLSSAFTIHTTNTTITLSSHYTTIGSYPTTPQAYNITIVRATDKEWENIEGKLVVFAGPPAYAAGLAVDVQKKGGIALVFQKIDHFRGGRAVAFGTPVSIPIVVVSEDTMEVLVSNDAAITSIELPAISSSEKSMINHMKAQVKAIIVLVTIMYCLLVPFFLYLFIFEVIYVYHNKGRYFSHNCMMKLVAVITSVLWLVWITVDPMGMKVRPNYDDTLICFLSGATLIALYLLILRILLLILNSTYFSSWHKTFISRVLYTLAVLFIVFFALLATVWKSPVVGIVFKYFVCTSVLVVGLIFAIVGKLMLDTLMGSGNRSKRANTIIARLSGFIAVYGVVSIMLLSVVHLYFHSDIYTTLVCALSHSVGLIFTFTLLFLRFPSQMHKPSLRSSPTPSTKSNRPSISGSDSMPSMLQFETETNSTNESFSETPRELSRLDSDRAFPMHERNGAP